ncbi:amino acid transporter [Cryphonectria parasitica EP155]|uniref:Amino acid transporter n=1 Tax=Cryphonectria parasitica (strain ATCC 38755 / EP155) TaxID=660469 RepID=A0A9P4Y1V8_CRYP1|nr:amino acid transporter [Cryphonectria parasitica EP155]KAF3765011.1 amino acid transporter [Cryphonectria parasitica EP155]
MATIEEIAAEEPMDPGRLEAKQVANSDDMELIMLGKSPKMKRVYNFWTLCAYQVMMCATWACVVVLYGTIFDIGGPVGLLYGSIAVAIGQTLLMASLAEYCGIWPTAGGQQFYVQVLASPKWRPLLSYLVGWALMTAEMSVSSSCAIQNANIIGSFIQTVHPDFEWTSWMNFLLYLAFIIVPLFMNLHASLLPFYSSFGAFLTVGGFFAWAITVLVKAPKSSAEFVFTTFLNNTGYTSSGWVFIMAFYNSIYGLYGTDAMMHLVEEMRNAAEDAPRAMVWSMIFAGVTTIVTDLILLFTCGNYASYAEELAPYVSWFAEISGSLYGGGLFISILFVIGNLLICVGVLASCSRLGWRMAEDKAFPYSDWLAKLHPKYGVPWNMMLVVFVVEIVVGLISLGSDLAFYAIVSGSGVFFQTAYIAPIIAVLVRGRHVLPERKHFDLGRWGLLINYISVAWALLVIVMYLCPLYLPVTGENIGNMNWACAIVGAEVLFSGLYWVYAARHKYLKESDVVLTAQISNQAQLEGQAVDTKGPQDTKTM